MGSAPPEHARVTSQVFLVVVLAAFPHAFWNAAVKGGNGKLAAMVAVVVGHALPVLAVLPFAPGQSLYACRPASTVSM